MDFSSPDFQRVPPVPGYMKRCARVYTGAVNPDHPIGEKTARRIFTAGFQDGRYNGFDRDRSPFHMNAVPASTVWYDDAAARHYATHHYQLGFWYGQLYTLPTGFPNPPSYHDLGPHREIASVSVLKIVVRLNVNIFTKLSPFWGPFYIAFSGNAGQSTLSR